MKSSEVRLWERFLQSVRKIATGQNEAGEYNNLTVLIQEGFHYTQKVNYSSYMWIHSYIIKPLSEYNSVL